MTNQDIIRSCTPIMKALHSKVLSNVIVMASALDAFPNYSALKKKFPDETVALYEELRNV